uniref:Uncharacterized protein n=1 Tax=Anguilla anguilla TaxID=7936 RepID=A0A0E9UNB9_ANGAN
MQNTRRTFLNKWHGFHPFLFIFGIDF